MTVLFRAQDLAARSMPHLPQHQTPHCGRWLSSKTVFVLVIVAPHPEASLSRPPELIVSLPRHHPESIACTRSRPHLGLPGTFCTPSLRGTPTCHSGRTGPVVCRHSLASTYFLPFRLARRPAREAKRRGSQRRGNRLGERSRRTCLLPAPRIEHPERRTMVVVLYLTWGVPLGGEAMSSRFEPREA